MIYTTPEKLGKVFGQFHPFGICAEYIKNLDNLKQEEQEIGLGIKAIIKPDDPLKTEGRFEAHRKFADIQLVVKGAEEVKVAPYASAEILEEYNSEKDIEWLNSKEEYSLLLKPGNLLVLFPWDAHKPSLIAEDNCKNVDKIIIKVPMSLLF